ncbi:unnamed protein product [Blumeria hordei]|uniref:SET domain-containing protein n=1 Tax=Blumeria hordei TaxID=2867405 RepID=A0A383UY20_BLUHO|nr:unnamed protein product [Blumeria hordei]
MDIYTHFVQWVECRGIVLHDIAATPFEGRGLGVRAQKRISAGATLLEVPFTALYTPESVPNPIRAAARQTRAHGLLAAALASNTPPAWSAVLPTRADLEASMPLCWPDALLFHLPPAASQLLKEQAAKLRADWASVSSAINHIKQRHYRYNWLLVNTRSFYFVPPTQRHRPPAPSNCLALNPFADCLNHSSTPSATVKPCGTSFVVSANTNIEADEEISISYGNHSNDFLLVEYGFIMEKNPWDEFLLDPWILARMSQAQINELDREGFLGSYILDRNTVCYRTQVALRLLCTSLDSWKNFLKGLDGTKNDERSYRDLLYQILEECRDHIPPTLAKISSFDDRFKSQKSTLTHRWNQIDLLVRAAMLQI